MEKHGLERYSYSLGLTLPLPASGTPVLPSGADVLDVLRAQIFFGVGADLTRFGKEFCRRKGGTVFLAVCENKHSEIGGVLVGKGNIV